MSFATTRVDGGNEYFGFGESTPDTLLHLNTQVAQTVPILKLESGAGFKKFFVTSSSPEGLVTADPGDFVQSDIVGVGAVWVKGSGAGNTGWLQLSTGTTGLFWYTENSVAPTIAPTVVAGGGIFAIGDGATVGVGATGSFVIGNGADADIGTDNIVLGTNAQGGATANGVAIGNTAFAVGPNSIGIGTSSNAVANGSIAIGNIAVTNGTQAIAIGTNATSGSTTGVAIGFNATSAGGAVAIGDGATNTSANQFALPSTITNLLLRGTDYVWAPNDGVSGEYLTTDGTGNLSFASKLPGYTVATLPAGTLGDTAYATDALAPVFLVAVVGGGAVATPVFHNGATWVAG